MVNLSEKAAKKIEELINSAEMGSEDLGGIFDKFVVLIDENKEHAYEISKYIPICMNPEREDGKNYDVGMRPENEFMNYLMTHAAKYDSRVLNDYLSYHEQHKNPLISFWSSNSGGKYGEHWYKGIGVESLKVVDKAMKEDKISAKRWYNLLKQESFFIKQQDYKQYLTNEFVPVKAHRIGDVWDSKIAKEEEYLRKYLANCVEKEPSLFKDFMRHVNATAKMNVFIGLSWTAVEMSNIIAQQKHGLTEENCEEIYKIAKSVDYENMIKMQPAILKIMRKNEAYIPKFSELITSIKNKDDILFIADVYEKLANKELRLEDNAESLPQETRLSDAEEQIKTACKKMIDDVNDKEILKVRLSSQFPLLSQDIESENNYINMCINNLEKPEKENIPSILNRLEATKANTIEDFMAAVDFVHRRDMFRKICERFNVEHPLIEDGEKYFVVEVNVDPGQLAYSMAEAGIRDKKTAEKVVDLFSKMNDRPGTFGSEYNRFYPEALKKMTKLEDWMLPVVKQAVAKNVVQPDNLGSPADLFDACKAWKINPKMPKAMAEQVGKMSLAKRMIAGAVIDSISKAEIELQENEMASWLQFRDKVNILRHNKELIPEFWKEMSRAQEMTFAEAMKTYITDSKINRKRFTAAMLEEMGIENSSDKFKETYRKLEAEGGFEKFLAAKGEERTLVSAEQMVKLARMKKHRAEVREESVMKHSSDARRRLAAKGLLPEKGKFGEGHQIKTPAKDMSQFKNYAR